MEVIMNRFSKIAFFIVILGVQGAHAALKPIPLLVMPKSLTTTPRDIMLTNAAIAVVFYGGQFVYGLVQRMRAAWSAPVATPALAVPVVVQAVVLAHAAAPAPAPVVTPAQIANAASVAALGTALVAPVAQQPQVVLSAPATPVAAVVPTGSAPAPAPAPQAPVPVPAAHVAPAPAAQAPAPVVTTAPTPNFWDRVLGRFMESHSNSNW